MQLKSWTCQPRQKALQHEAAALRCKTEALQCKAKAKASQCMPEALKCKPEEVSQCKFGKIDCYPKGCAAPSVVQCQCNT